MAKSKIPLTPEGGTRGVICQVESLFSFVSSTKRVETLSYCTPIPLAPKGGMYGVICQVESLFSFVSIKNKLKTLSYCAAIPPFGVRGIGARGILFLFLLGLFACNQTPNPTTEGIISGTTTIVADESVFTIVDDEAEIFALNYKQAQIKFNYQPEQKLVKLFLSDSIKTAIMARDLTPQEKQHFLDQKIVIRTNRFAIDGIALIVNKASTDSVITIQQLKDALVGKFKSDKAWVFDNTQSSTLAYLMQFAGVKTFASNVYALQSNKEVIKYVSAHPQAVGVVSLSWLVRPTPDVENELKNIKLLALSGDDKKYHKPTQSTLKTGKYPLTRNLFIHNCQGSAGLGTGFASFLAGELGQRIILKAGLAPDSLPSRQLNFK